MLYDPKWGKPSLAGFVAWLEKQPPEEAYKYKPADNCAIGKYLKSVSTTYDDYCSEGGFRNLCDWNTYITCPQRGAQTFGAALKRAKAYMKEQACVQS